MMDSTPVPDISGKDLMPAAARIVTDSPTIRAQALAKQLEVENTERLRRLATYGIAPEAFLLNAIQCRLEALIETLPDAHRALVEVSYETAFAHELDEALTAVGKPKLHVPGT